MAHQHSVLKRTPCEVGRWLKATMMQKTAFIVYNICVAVNDAWKSLSVAKTMSNMF